MGWVKAADWSGNQVYTWNHTLLMLELPLVTTENCGKPAIRPQTYWVDSSAVDAAGSNKFVSNYCDPAIRRKLAT